MYKKNKNRNIKQIKKTLDWIFHMLGYTIVFILVTSLFKSIVIDENHLIIWSMIIVFVIYILNKTIKPILVTLTIPITALTLGLFYPCINVFILKLVDWMLGKHFEIKDIWVALLVAVLLSTTNFIMEKTLEKILKKVKIHE